MRKLLLLVWLPLFVFLFPLPPQVAKQMLQEASPAELDVVTSALWVVWMQNLGLMALGLIVGVIAWRGYRHWRLFALGMSISYLALVVVGYVSVDRAVPDSLLLFETESNVVRILQLNLRLVEVGISRGSVIRPAWIIYNEILMPIFQLTVLASMLWFYARRTRPQ